MKNILERLEPIVSRHPAASLVLAWLATAGLIAVFVIYLGPGGGLAFTFGALCHAVLLFIYLVLDERCQK